MKVVFLHDDIPPNARLDELDVFAQIDAINAALAELGHTSARMAFTFDLHAISAELRRLSPNVVFNLVEAVGGQGRLVHFATALLDGLGFPYTGNPTEPMFLTAGKLLTKRILRAHGVATPPWLASTGPSECSGRAPYRPSSEPEAPAREKTEPEAPARGKTEPEAPARDQTEPEAQARGQFEPKLPLPGRYIIKSVWEEASVGLEDDAIVEARDTDTLRAEIQARAGRPGGEAFAEAFIDGREFNLSVLAGADGPEVLPPAEIDFLDYPDGKPKVVGYRAKWDAESFEYHHTPRRFDFPPADGPLVAELVGLTRKCWAVLGLAGYARVDFRVDAAGRPWVLEVNANPCLSPDAGFAAAAERGGLTFKDVVGRLLGDAQRRARMRTGTDT